MPVSEAWERLRPVLREFGGRCAAEADRVGDAASEPAEPSEGSASESGSEEEPQPLTLTAAQPSAPPPPDPDTPRLASGADRACQFLAGPFLAEPGGTEEDAVRILQRQLVCEHADAAPDPDESLLRWARQLHEEWEGEVLLSRSAPPLLQCDWQCPDDGARRHVPRAPPQPWFLPSGTRSVFLTDGQVRRLRAGMTPCCAARNMAAVVERMQLQIQNAVECGAVDAPGQREVRREARAAQSFRALLSVPPASVPDGIAAVFLYTYVPRAADYRPRDVTISAVYAEACSVADPAARAGMTAGGEARRLTTLQLLRPLVAQLSAFLRLLPDAGQWTGCCRVPQRVVDACGAGALLSFTGCASLVPLQPPRLLEGAGPSDTYMLVTCRAAHAVEPFSFDDVAEETLLQPKTVFEVAAALPAAVSALLQCSPQVAVLWQREPGARHDLTPAQVVQMHVRAHQTMRAAFRPFMSQYVMPSTGQEAVCLNRRPLKDVFAEWLALTAGSPGWRELCIIGDAGMGKTAAAMCLAALEWPDDVVVVLLPVSAVPDPAHGDSFERALFDALALPHSDVCDVCSGVGRLERVADPRLITRQDLRRGVLPEPGTPPPRCRQCNGSGRWSVYHDALRRFNLVVVLDGCDETQLHDPARELKPEVGGHTLLARSGLCRDRWPDARVVATVRSDFLLAHELSPCHLLGRPRVTRVLERHTVDEFDALLHSVNGRKKTSREVLEVSLRVSWESTVETVWLQRLEPVQAEEVLQLRLGSAGLPAPALLRRLSAEVAAVPLYLTMAAEGKDHLDRACAYLGTETPGVVEVYEASLRAHVSKYADGLRSHVPSGADAVDFLLQFCSHVAVHLWRRGCVRFCTADVAALPLMSRVRDSAAMEELAAALPVRRGHATDRQAALSFKHRSLLQYLVSRVAVSSGGRVSTATAAYVRLREVQHPCRGLLHVAAEWDHPALVRTLLLAGAARDRRDDKGRSPLLVAAQRRHICAASALMEAGAEDTDAVLRDWGPALLDKAARSGDAARVRFFLGRGAAANEPTFSGTALHAAAASDDDAVVAALVGAGASTQATDAEGLTPLALATGRGRVRTGCALIEAEQAYRRAGTQPTSDDAPAPRTSDGATLWHAQELLRRAVSCGDTDAVRRLLRAGAGHSDAGTDGWRPLHAAARAGHAGCLRALHQAGASVNATDDKGRTALYYAATQCHVEAIDALIELGAAPSEGTSSSTVYVPQQRREEQLAAKLGQLISSHRSGSIGGAEFADEKKSLLQQHQHQQRQATQGKARCTSPFDACGLLCQETSRVIASHTALSRTPSPTTLPPLRRAPDHSPAPARQPQWASSKRGSLGSRRGTADTAGS